MIDLRRLRAFVILAEEQSVTRAADRLGMQQPPLSRLLRGLEQELGVTLVERLPRGVRLTASGEILLAEARTLLARANALPRIVGEAHRGERGRLAVGFTSSAAFHPFVSKALRAYRESLPDVAVLLEEAGSSELADALMQERIDAAFIRSSITGMTGLRVDVLLDEPMLAALPVGHALTAGDSPVPLSDLAVHPLILYRRATGPGLYDAILTAFRAQGVSPDIVQEAPRLTATLSLVAAGLGLSIVPASMRRLGGEDIVYRPIADRLSAPIGLITRASDATPTAARFRSLMLDLSRRP